MLINVLEVKVLIPTWLACRHYLIESMLSLKTIIEVQNREVIVLRSVWVLLKS